MSVAEVLRVLEKVSGIGFSEVVSDEGASKSDYLLQAIAGFSGKRVVKPKNLEGTSRGAFLLARGAMLGLSLKDSWIPLEVEKVFEPGQRKIERWEEIMKFALKMAR